MENENEFSEDEVFEGYTGLDEFLFSKEDNFPISVSELDFIVDEISAKYSLSNEKSKRILSSFFHEIRTLVLKNNVVFIRRFGKFYIHLGTTKCFVTFKPNPNLKKKIKYV